MELLVLVDVIGAYDVGVGEGGEGAGLAVKALQVRRVVSQGGRQYLDGDPPVRRFMLTQVDAAHTAGAETLKYLVLADSEAAPFALKDLLGLEDRQDTVTDKQVGDLGRLIWPHGARSA